MCTFIVVILNILINADAQGFRRIILLEIDVFPFQGSPEALSDSVIKGSTLTTHADEYIVFLQKINVAWAGKLAALIAIHDIGFSVQLNCFLDGFDDKFLGHGGGQLVTNNHSRIPVDYRYEIHPATPHGYVGDVNPPDMVGVRRLNIS